MWFFAQNHFILEVLSNWLVHKFSSKSDEVLILAPIYWHCLDIKSLNFSFKFVFSTLKLAGVQRVKYVWRDFILGTVFAQIFIFIFPNIVKWLI